MGNKLTLPTLPLTIGLCPVHYEEFYFPVHSVSNRHPKVVRCPERGCRETLVLYDMVALTALSPE